MASGFGERQRVEEFARLLDGLADDRTARATGVATLDARIPSQRTSGVDEELAEMLRAVEAVISLGEDHGPIVRRQFKEDLGRRLHAEFAALFDADGDGNGGGGEPAGRHRTAASAWRRRLLSGGLVIGVASGGVGGVAWAASGALPGDPLYGVKRSLENMRVSVSGSDLERGEQYIGQAGTRLAEIHHLLDRKDANVDGSDPSKWIATTMDALYSDVQNAGQLLAPLAEKGDPNALNALTKFLNSDEPQIADLEVLLAPESQDKARRLVALMQSYDARAAAAKVAIDRATAAKNHPGGGPTSAGGRRSGASPSASPTGAVSDATEAAPANGGATAPGGTKAVTPGPDAPASPEQTVSVQVPIGSPATTVVVPPLLSGLPPIGITLGNTNPPTGPTTNAGPAPTDPNPN
jgi:hypothetical protein